MGQRDSLSSSVAGSLVHDPFGNGLAGFQAQVGADSADIPAMGDALATLVKNGLDPKGALYQALASSGDLNTAQQLAALGSQDLFAQQAAFDQRGSLASSLGSTVGNQAFGASIEEARDATKELRQEVKHLRQTVALMEKAVERGAKEGAKQGTRDVGGAVREGARDGIRDRDHGGRVQVRTGGR